MLVACRDVFHRLSRLQFLDEVEVEAERSDDISNFVSLDISTPTQHKGPSNHVHSVDTAPRISLARW